MFISFSILFVLALLIISNKLTKTTVNPLFCFLLLWLIILIFSSLSLYGLNKANNFYLNLILLGLTVFSIIYTISYNYFPLINQQTKKLRIHFVYLLTWLSLVYYIYAFVAVVGKIGFSNLWSVQQYIRNTDTDSYISSVYIQFFGSFVAGPVSTILPIISVSNFFSKNKHYKLLVLSILVLLFKSLSTASRSTLLFIFIYFILAFLITSTKKTLARIFNKKTILIVTLVIIVFVILSNSRRLSLWKNLYLDFAIQPIMFEEWGNVLDISHQYGFGLASFNGFLFLINYFLDLLSGGQIILPYFDTVYQMINSTVDNWVMAGIGVPANAYVSIFWFFYYDFRILGIILGCCIFAIYCSLTYKSYLHNRDAYSLAKCLFMFQIVFYSFVRFQFALPNIALSFIYLYFVLYSKKK